MSRSKENRNKFPSTATMSEALAGALKKKGESAGEEQVPLAGESFDPVAYRESARKAYAEIGRGLVEKGINPQEFSAEAWREANKTLDTLRQLSKEYEKETDPKKKEKVATHIQRLGASLGGRISNEVKRAAREYAEDREDKSSGRFTKGEKRDILGEVLRRIPETKEGPSVSEIPSPEAVPAVVTPVEAGEPAAAPLSLEQIFGDKVPSRVREMYSKLGKRKREDYLRMLRADEAEKRRRREGREARRAARTATEVPSAPAADEEPAIVPQAVEAPVEEETGTQTADVDERGMRTPQYARRKMQAEMDAFSRAAAISPEPGPSPEPEPESEQREVDVPGEEREKLRVLLEKMEKLSREESSEQAAPAETGRLSFSERTEKLSERSAALDAEAEKRGWLGNLFHSMNEKFKKLSPLKKFGITVGLGAGVGAAAALSTFSLPALLALL